MLRSQQVSPSSFPTFLAWSPSAHLWRVVTVCGYWRMKTFHASDRLELAWRGQPVPLSEQKIPCQDTAGGPWVFEICIFCLLIAFRMWCRLESAWDSVPIKESFLCQACAPSPQFFRVPLHYASFTMTSVSLWMFIPFLFIYLFLSPRGYICLSKGIQLVWEIVLLLMASPVPSRSVHVTVLCRETAITGHWDIDCCII